MIAVTTHQSRLGDEPSVYQKALFELRQANSLMTGMMACTRTPHGRRFCRDIVRQTCYLAGKEMEDHMAGRTEKLDLRLTPEAKRTLFAAADAARRSVSDFVLESALTRAEETLADRTRFGLTAERWQAFQEALDAPPSEMPRLCRLLSEKSAFEHGDRS